MFEFFKKKKPTTTPAAGSVSVQMREVLFGDLGWEAWPPAGSGAAGEPWASFRRARDLRARGDVAAAAEVLRNVAAMRDVESRHTLQAWHFLRLLGQAVPAEEAKRVLGVVVEVALPAGLDVLAAYADRRARYWNHANAGAVWERPDDSMDGLIDRMLSIARGVVEQIGPWDGARPGPPTTGQLRLNMLTPSGLHFGQGPMDVLIRDPMGGPLFAAGANLMKALVERVLLRRDS